MEYPEIKSVRTSVSYWYIILLIGLIYLAVGFMVLARPVVSLIALTALLGFGFLMAGGIEIIFSLANRKEMHNWGWPFVLGILTCLIGILFISNPDFTILLMTLTMGFLVLFRSIAAIVLSLDLKHYGAKYCWVLMALGYLESSKGEHLSMEGIAREVGFKSRTTFIKAFKMKTGYTPSQHKTA